MARANRAPSGQSGPNVANVQAAQRRNLKQAYRLLARRGLILEESLPAMSRLRDPLVDELIAFVRSSTRGFCRPRRSTSWPRTGTASARVDREGVQEEHDPRLLVSAVLGRDDA
jgi:hypothetical protein